MELMTDVVSQAFGAGSDQATRFVELLTVHGVERGLIGPREVDRLWDRHVLNSVAIAECVPDGATVIDVGSGAGFPGIPLAIARPDLDVVLLEPMARRVAWLEEVVTKLDLDVTVVRGRAEEKEVRRTLANRDVVTARAVAPMGKLAGWCLPLLRGGGRMVALKGSSAAEEIERDRTEIARAGGVDPEVRTCGGEFLDEPTTVVVVRRAEPAAGRNRKRR
ncbi:16S rRNA (guanine(527)-N(7))-methyltransferase RsmG [Kibdelosporangium phytohabitans]|uniref:Ribosomal RNA small subunit methyltransferase G n=1 Tax=Kibdelosporangium phytohabitans TaxID=860235 RepID=A0A0N9I366_9PSEU|nr:16S rRNA (guanine(527)-N(7))-methyltransferase RsmG [Kibdelosporangium phytohabitans]MBE1466531.1 16S rRNA (guanine527-N7)-methyltransferase [Kibdelosporangium phytohabitans]